MDVRVETVSVTEVECDALVVNLFSGVKSPGGATGAVDAALGGAISEAAASGETTGKQGETTLFHTKLPAKRVLVVGLGKPEEFDLNAVRKVSGQAAKFLREKGCKKIATIVHGAGIGGLDPADAARATVEGAILALYRGDLYKAEKERNEIETFTLVERDPEKARVFETAAREGKILADATNYTRTLGDEPANRMTPAELAECAAELGPLGVEVRVMLPDEMRSLGMGGLLAVAQGSREPARFIVMRWRGGGRKLALVGKGITFDSGGISIKPSKGMGDMKYDMTGGAAVIGAMRAIAALKPAIEVIGIVPATENMPSGSAYRPGDVITMMSGKTVEISTTDAEGRMILADALTYAVREGAECIVDVATLTGACVVALGKGITGVMSNDRELLGRLDEAADSAGERVWELPLPKDYKDLLKSNIADLKNAGNRWAGAIQGGLFLQEFVEGVPWVHMDIAGPSDTKDGATGVGVRTLAMLAKKLSR
ncbi:MAG: leucyl aminopeptidase [Armatimonadota bacterium]